MEIWVFKLQNLARLPLNGVISLCFLEASK